MTVNVTVTLDCTREVARARLEQAGFKVVRVTASPGKVTPRDPTMRASARTDMPPDLTHDEHWAYVRGYARGAMAYAKKHGIVSSVTNLRQRTIDYEWERHPACHRAGMAELRKHQDAAAAYRRFLAEAS
jgi:hypothetical protein